MNVYLEYEHKEKLIKGTVLEMACGEAPFIAQRYNVVTGDPIAIEDREGILDIKIKQSNNMIIEGYPCAWTPNPYSMWYPNVALGAFKTVFGTEKYLPSLIIARVNLLLSFIEYSRFYFENKKYFRTHECPLEEDIREIANIICWNFWLMDLLNPKDEIIQDWETGEIIKVKDLLKTSNDNKKQQLDLF